MGHNRALCSGNPEIQPGDAAVEVRTVPQHHLFQQKGRSDQPQLDRYLLAPKRRSGTSHYGIRFGTAPTGGDVRDARRSQDCCGPAIERTAGWDRPVRLKRPQRMLHGSARSRGKDCVSREERSRWGQVHLRPEGHSKKKNGENFHIQTHRQRCAASIMRRIPPCRSMATLTRSQLSVYGAFGQPGLT